MDLLLPITNVTYTNESDVLEVSFLKELVANVTAYIESSHIYFVDLCYCCNVSILAPLLRCSGCQLVAYCSRDCQRANWQSHKKVCKEFPVVKGKNVLCTGSTGTPWKKHIAGLRERAAHLPHSEAEVAAKSIFRNPRVCRTCREASRPDHLTIDCACACVSYCNKRCAKADKMHHQDCNHLQHIALSYVNSYQQEMLPCDAMLLDEIVFDRFDHVYSWSDIFPPKYNQILQIMLRTEDIHTDTAMKLGLNIERLSYPISLLYALQTLPKAKRHLGIDQRPLEELTTLDVHIVISNPLFNSEPWEVLMHRLPKLKQLNVVFIIQGHKEVNQTFKLNKELRLQRCADCKAKERVITYSVRQQSQYHMFFSSEEYTEPDVVVVYGNADEMISSPSEEQALHSEISYRNMTYSRDTVLVLMDKTKELVRLGAKAVNAARTVDQLVPPQINPFKGFGSNRADVDSDVPITNEKSYFTCLRRN